MTVTPFIILASPRSRTAWLATWLSDGVRVCWHDMLGRVDEPATLKEIVGQENGIVETAGAYYYRTLFDLFPKARFATIRRDEREMAESLRRNGVSLGNARSVLLALDDAEAWLSSRTKVLSLSYQSLVSEANLELLWSHLRGDAFDALRTRRLAAMRIEKIKPFWTDVAPAISAHEQLLRQMVK